MLQESTSSSLLNLLCREERLSVYNWKPGPRRGTEDAIEKQIAGKWHLITLQEASDYVNHAILHERFYVSHFAGCAVLFNKDTFYPNIDVKPHISSRHEAKFTRSYCRRRTWMVLQGVVSPASFRRAASSGQTAFTVLSLHINNIYAKERGIAKKIIQAVRALVISHNFDLVAGDFNGAAWRCRSRDNLSSIEEAFADCALPPPPGPPHLCGTWIHPGQLGRCLWFSEATWFQEILESEQTWAHFPFLDKLSVCAHMIKAATTKHGCTCTSSNGVTSGITRLATTGTFASQNVLRMPRIVLPNATFSMY